MDTTKKSYCCYDKINLFRIYITYLFGLRKFIKDINNATASIYTLGKFIDRRGNSYRKSHDLEYNS
jgi:hypothetical protein